MKITYTIKRISDIHVNYKDELLIISKHFVFPYSIENHV